MSVCVRVWVCEGMGVRVWVWDGSVGVRVSEGEGGRVCEGKGIRMQVCENVGWE